MPLNLDSQQSEVFEIKDWEFTQADQDKPKRIDEWIPCKIPTSVHVELLDKDKILDPFIGLNEWDVQWIGEATWKFRTSFQIEFGPAPSVPAVPRSHSEQSGTFRVSEGAFAMLRFEGLDTYCTVTLNGKKLTDRGTKKTLAPENQFIAYESIVYSHEESLLNEGQNDLELIFPSTFLKGRELEKENGGKRQLWNGDSSRLYVRKAQYNYGWDWGPVLMTAGPWRPITLVSYHSRIEGLRTVITFRDELNVRVDVTFDLEGHYEEITADCILTRKDGKKDFGLKAVELKDRKGSVAYDIKLDKEDLWNPVGYGDQTLYVVKVTLKKGDKTRDEQEKQIGFRRVQVVQDTLEGEDGHSFLFEVNGTRIFCGGSNWIPADSFLTTMTRDRYKDWLQLLVDGNQNMIRIWGGGIYEHDDFYDICDELGILVWQDFMFGCGLYPAHDEFLELVAAEAEYNVKRLRHHPSIVIFAGNNEDYQIAESHGLVDYNDETSDYRKSDFPARYTYEKVLAGIVEKNSEIHYHRGSPYSGFKQKTTDPKNGDIHQWNVWHGSQEPWHNWDILAGRFVSEFGMEAYPNIRTVDKWLGGNTSERYPQSRTNCNHNKADGFERRLELYLVENFKHAFDMESYVYYTQIMQAECIAAAYRLWRRNWKGKGKEYTAGALVWQLNDCWPVTSWAIIDYYLRPKPAYFAIARELRPYTVGMTRKEKKTGDTAATLKIETELEIWGTNSRLEEKSVTLLLESFDLDTDGEKKDELTKKVVLAPNSSTEIWKGVLPGQPTRTKNSEIPKPIVIHARLVDGDNNNNVLSRYSSWPEPYKFIHFPKNPGLNIVKKDKETFELSCEKPIKGLVLDIKAKDERERENDDEAKWSDQAIDLFPGDTQTIQAKRERVIVRNNNNNGQVEVKEGEEEERAEIRVEEIKKRYLGDGTA